MYVISDIDDLKAFEFLDKGRLFSTDGNINFRLQIWQDVLLDSFEQFRYLIGVDIVKKFQLCLILGILALMVLMNMFIIIL